MYFSNRLSIIGIMLIILLLNACDNKSIVVPTSDNTPPTISISIDFTTTDGQRKTIELTQDSADVSFDLDPAEPIAALASARDTNGGVMGIVIIGHIFDICDNASLGTDINFGLPDIPNSGGPGDTASTVKVTDFTFNPLNHCPSGDSNSDGFIAAYAENFHNGSVETASFSFEYKD
jgi:hypothetical protein